MVCIPEIPESIVNVQALQGVALPRARRCRQTSRAKRRRRGRTIRPSTRRHDGNRQRQRQLHENVVPMMIPLLHCPREIRDGTSGESRCTATVNSTPEPMPDRALGTRNSRLFCPSIPYSVFQIIYPLCAWKSRYAHCHILFDYLAVYAFIKGKVSFHSEFLFSIRSCGS